jgi:hypothetical protein
MGFIPTVGAIGERPLIPKAALAPDMTDVPFGELSELMPVEPPNIEFCWACKALQDSRATPAETMEATDRKQRWDVMLRFSRPN